jgi:hypothetical protein
LNAGYARYLEVRRLLLIGQLTRAEEMLADLDPTLFPPASRTFHELVVAGIAMRRLRTKEARAALARARHAAHQAGIPALMAEVESASHILNTPAARVIARGGERVLLLEDGFALVPRHGSEVVVLARPVEQEHGNVLAYSRMVSRGRVPLWRLR